jgi:DNA primase
LSVSRIPKAEIERIKRDIPTADVCVRHGLELKPQGKDLVACCPFHEEDTASFHVTPENNLWHCFGCDAGGDNIQFVMKKENVSFRHAVEKLQTMVGVTPAPAKLITRQGTEHPVLVDPATEMADHALMNHVTDFYHQTFLNQSAAMQYLQKRCCFHPEAVKLFRLGYANRSLGYRIPSTTAGGKKLKAQLQRLGILRESGHEHLNGSIVIPLLDPHGHPVQMYGRKIIHNLRPGTFDHLYLPGPHRAVWNAKGVAGHQEWLLCEALLDALTLWSAGFRNVTCTYGVRGWTEEHDRLILEHPPKRIILCFDNDDAGNPAALKLAERLKKQGIETWRAKLPPGKDINAVACAHPKNPAGALAACIESSPVVAVATSPVPTPSAPEPSPLAAPAPPEKPAAKKEKPAEPVKPAVSVEPALPPSAALPVEPTLPEEPPVSQGDEYTFTLGERAWRVRGLSKNLSYETLKVQLRVMRSGKDGVTTFHLDTLDMANAKHRQNYLDAAAQETGLAPDLLKKDMGQVLLRLEEHQELHIKNTLTPQTKEVTVAEAERETALELLRDPKLLDRVLTDFEKCGVIGEATNKLVGYLAAVSRKLDEPLAIIIQSTSAAGKSSLMEAVLAFVPPEERIKYSAMTGQSLYYMGDTDLQHKVLAIVEEEGAEKASYALKLLQSEGELSIASTGKDPHTGRMITQEYRVTGPVMILLTTTAIDIDEELMNRCIVLTVDESRAQTKAIHVLQREAETLAGLLRKEDKKAILTIHRNAQRLLRPLRVVNPFAPRLTFLDDRTRTRRDHTKYLTLIRTLALLHQYQRPVKTAGKVQYIEATLEDITVANRLAGEVLGRSLDELPPQTRRLLLLVEDLVGQNCRRLKIDRSNYRFSRRDVRQVTGWSDTALKVHLRRLEEMEYLLVHRAARGQGYVYELLYGGEGRDGKPFLMGLLDVDSLKYDGERSGQNGHRSAPGQGVVSPQSGPGQPAENGAPPLIEAGYAVPTRNGLKNHALSHAR